MEYISKEAVEDLADGLYLRGLRKDNRILIEKACSDDLEESRAGMEVYNRIDAREQEQLRKDATEDLETVMKEFEKARSETIIKSGDSEAVRGLGAQA